MRPYTNAYLRGAQGYFLKKFKKVRKSQVASIEKIVVVGVSGMFKGRRNAGVERAKGCVDGAEGAAGCLLGECFDFFFDVAFVLF